MSEKFLNIIQNFSQHELVQFLHKNHHGEFEEIFLQENVSNGQIFLQLDELQILKWKLPSTARKKLVSFIEEVKNDAEIFLDDTDITKYSFQSRRQGSKRINNAFTDKLENFILPKSPPVPLKPKTALETDIPGTYDAETPKTPTFVTEKLSKQLSRKLSGGEKRNAVIALPQTPSKEEKPRGSTLLEKENSLREKRKSPRFFSLPFSEKIFSFLGREKQKNDTLSRTPSEEENPQKSTLLERRLSEGTHSDEVRSSTSKRSFEAESEKEVTLFMKTPSEEEEELQLFISSPKRFPENVKTEFTFLPGTPSQEVFATRSTGTFSDGKLGQLMGIVAETSSEEGKPLTPKRLSQRERQKQFALQSQTLSDEIFLPESSDVERSFESGNEQKSSRQTSIEEGTENTTIALPQTSPKEETQEVSRILLRTPLEEVNLPTPSRTFERETEKETTLLLPTSLKEEMPQMQPRNLSLEEIQKAFAIQSRVFLPSQGDTETTSLTQTSLEEKTQKAFAILPRRPSEEKSRRISEGEAEKSNTILLQTPPEEQIPQMQPRKLSLEEIQKAFTIQSPVFQPTSRRPSQGDKEITSLTQTPLEEEIQKAFVILSRRSSEEKSRNIFEGEAENANTKLLQTPPEEEILQIRSKRVLHKERRKAFTVASLAASEETLSILRRPSDTSLEEETPEISRQPFEEENQQTILASRSSSEKELTLTPDKPSGEETQKAIKQRPSTLSPQIQSNQDDSQIECLEVENVGKIEDRYDEHGYLILNSIEEHDCELSPSVITSSMNFTLRNPIVPSERSPLALPRNSTDERGYIIGPDNLNTNLEQNNSQQIFPRVVKKTKNILRSPSSHISILSKEHVDHESTDYNKISGSTFYPKRIKKPRSFEEDEVDGCKNKVNARKTCARTRSESHLSMRYRPLPPLPVTNDQPKLSTVTINTELEQLDTLKVQDISFEDILRTIAESVNVTNKTKKQRRSKSENDLKGQSATDQNCVTINQSKLEHRSEKDFKKVQLGKTGKKPLPLPPSFPVQLNLEHLMIEESKTYLKSYLKNEPFFRNTDREGAKNILTDLGDGGFLFRPSNRFFLTLSLKYRGECFHLGIEKTMKNKLLLDTPYKSPEFETLTEFVDHFTRNKLKFAYEGKVLETLLMKSLPPTKH